MIRKIFLFSISLVIFISLSACVNLHVNSQKSFNKKTMQQRNAKRQQIRSWKITGAFSISQPKQQPVMANYHWTQRGSKTFHINISAPLRAVVVNINGTPRGVSLSQSGQKTIYAKSATDLLRKQLGWNFPIRYLYNWLRALPASGSLPSLLKYDSYGHLIKLRQQGWEINYSKYQTVSGVDLPRMLRLKHKNLRIKLVIKQWRI